MRKVHIKSRLERMKTEQPEALSIPHLPSGSLGPCGYLTGAAGRVQVMASYSLGSELEAILWSQVLLSLRLASKVLRMFIKL